MTIENNSRFSFNSRETYVAWVKEWKESYRALSELIRNTKREMKEEQKASILSYSDKQSHREYMRTRARKMLIERAEAKVEAQRQYVAAQEAREAA